MSKITKLDSKGFIDGVSEGILELGGKYNGVKFNSHEFSLDTIAGKLNISIRDEQSLIYCVFARFEEVERAKEKFDCNPYSGKYNFMISNIGVDKAIECALIHLECTLPNK